jgi:hypothetical protein
VVIRIELMASALGLLSTLPSGELRDVARFVEEAFAEEPEAYGNGEPDQSCEGEDDPGTGAGEPDPADESEAGESDAAHCGAISFDGCDGAASVGAVVASAGLVFFLVGFDEAGSGGEDGGEGEEESSDNRAAVLGDEAGGHANSSAEDESDDPFVRLDSLDCREAGPD